MVEGKGYCARRQDRRKARQMAEFIKKRKKIIVIPDSMNYNEKERKDKIKSEK
jgi:hypothetical protein